MSDHSLTSCAKRALSAAVLAATAFVLPAPVLADTALLVGNSRYDHGARIREGGSVIAATSALRDAGFDVITARDADAADLRAALADLLDADETRRVVIALAGHFAHAPDGGLWFLGTDARLPDRVSAPAQGIALSTVMALAAQAPGGAVVLLATEDRRFATGRGVASGLELPEAPQGVTVIAGSTRAIPQLLWGPLLEPGRPVAQAIAGNDALSTTGFLPSQMPFIALPDPVALPGDDPAEADLWAAASELDNEGAYRAYLQEYPRGQFAPEARRRLSALQADPVRQAEAAEDALNLSRNDRRQIQRDLTVLGHDTRGIDGIFGAGSRTAIAAWQRADGRSVTGYLTRIGISRIAAQAETRRAEIEAEEAAAQATRDRQDRAYWRAVGEGRDEPGLRAYLDRYPDGIFADVARARLEDITGEAEEPEAPDTPDIAALEAAEAALNLPAITKLLIERRLDSGGYGPGPVDGRFDATTRAAIADFQADNELTATGYLDRDTAARFLSNGLQIILR